MDPFNRSTAASAAVAAVEAPASAVSWGAILAGAFVIAASTIILLAVGTALGFSTMSPWPGHGASVATVTAITAIWLVVVQWLSAALGGYITGRLRTRWTGIHTDEVFFRDTAHGLLAWAVAAVIGVAMLSGLAAGTVGLGVQAGATVASGAASGVSANVQQAYQVETLFRPQQQQPQAQPPANHFNENAEAGHILAVSTVQGSISPADKAYLAQLISARAGISADDANKRIDAVNAQLQAAKDKARQAADAARKATAASALFAGLSMLVGAFIAAVSGALGGRLRDLP